ncbi:MAG: hypothetical protein R3Y07_02360 [Eubacteriales bacterium]
MALLISLKQIRLMYALSLVYLAVLGLEALLFQDIIVFDPRQHLFTFEYYTYYMQEWVMPSYWEEYSPLILLVVLGMNLGFSSLSQFFLLFMWLGKYEKDTISIAKPWLFLSYWVVVGLDLGIRWFLKNQIEYYRVFMYGSFPALLALLILIHFRKIVFSSIKPYYLIENI